MDFLVVSYSRTGNNAVLGEVLAERLGCSHERIKAGKVSLFFAAISSMLKLRKKVGLIDVKDKYVVLCTPAWMGRIPAPMRGFLYGHKLSKFALASLSGSGDNKRMVAKVALIAGRKPGAVVELAADTQKMNTVFSKRDLKKRFARQIDGFVASL